MLLCPSGTPTELLSCLTLTLAQAEYPRVIAGPFRCASGKVTLEGTEETDVDRDFDVPRCDYKLTAAQAVIGGGEERIDLFVKPVSVRLMQSSIVVADQMLSPPEPLIETPGIAGDNTSCC
jgi:hypothetical protein